MTSLSGALKGVYLYNKIFAELTTCLFSLCIEFGLRHICDQLAGTVPNRIRWDFKLSIIFLRLFFTPFLTLPRSFKALCEIPDLSGWVRTDPRGPLLCSGISEAIGLSWGPVSHTKLMSAAGNDTFSRICHSKPPQTHVISAIHSRRDCLEMHHSFKSQWA